MTVQEFLAERRKAHYPPGWELFRVAQDGGMWVNRKEQTSVIVSVAVESDGRLWAHASIARKGRMPSYEDLQYLRRYWLNNRKAIQVFPESEFYVNLHPHCLHLFACLDGDPLPEFSARIEGVGRTL